jgi:O-antigen ligase
MSDLSRRRAISAVESFLAAPRFANALAVTSIGAAVFVFLLHRLIGWGGFLGALAVLVALAAAGLVARRATLTWPGFLPISLLAFCAWLALSLVWSEYQWVTLGSVVYFGAFTLLGLFVALARDTIQIVRAFGDVMRVALGLSLVVEVIIGLLLDTRVGFLSIQGNIDELGPIQGVMGTRNQLGILALMAAITFGTELRTRSVDRGLGLGSLALAAACIVLSRSPVIFAVLVVVAAAAGALYGLRRVAKQRRTFWYLALLVAIALGGVVVWLARGRIVELFNAGGSLDYRLNIWRQMWALISAHALEGWGWVGPWRAEVQPFPAFANTDGSIPSSGLNAFLDLWFQLGLVGVVLFSSLVGLALVRSWLNAGRQRSIIHAWPALILVGLVTVSLAESTILTPFGWLIFVVCCVKAGQELSWRKAFESPLVQEPLP